MSHERRWYTTWAESGSSWVALARCSAFADALAVGKRWQGGHRTAAVRVNRDGTDTAPARMVAMLAPPASWAA